MLIKTKIGNDLISIEDQFQIINTYNHKQKRGTEEIYFTNFTLNYGNTLSINNISSKIGINLIIKIFQENIFKIKEWSVLDLSS